MIFHHYSFLSIEKIKPSLHWHTELSRLSLSWSARSHMMSTVATSSADRSDVVLFPCNKSMRSSGMLSAGMQRYKESRSLSRSECTLCLCFHFVVNTLKQEINSCCQRYLGSRERNYGHSALKTYPNNLEFLLKEYWRVECLWHCCRTWTPSC